jgi:hypothetical protein
LVDLDWVERGRGLDRVTMSPELIVSTGLSAALK